MEFTANTREKAVTASLDEVDDDDGETRLLTVPRTQLNTADLCLETLVWDDDGTLGWSPKSRRAFCYPAMWRTVPGWFRSSVVCLMSILS